MKKTGVALVLVVCVVLALCAFAPGALAKKGPSATGTYPGVLPPWSTPNGLSYGDWGVGWWQWMFGQPASSCPNFDMTGAGFPWGQDLDAPVLYLPGTWGGPATRDLTIPAGKALFVPLVNAAYVLFPEDPVDFSWVTEFMDTVSAAKLTVDGRLMDLFRPAYRTGLYAPNTAEFPEDSLVGITGPLQFGCDGYYAMLAPLRVGGHTIVVHGEAGEGEDAFSVDLTFNVTVVGE